MKDWPDSLFPANMLFLKSSTEHRIKRLVVKTRFDCLKHGFELVKTFFCGSYFCILYLMKKPNYYFQLVFWKVFKWFTNHETFKKLAFNYKYL